MKASQLVSGVVGAFTVFAIESHGAREQQMARVLAGGGAQVLDATSDPARHGVAGDAGEHLPVLLRHFRPAVEIGRSHGQQPQQRRQFAPVRIPRRQALAQFCLVQKIGRFDEPRRIARPQRGTVLQDRAGIGRELVGALLVGAFVDRQGGSVGGGDGVHGQASAP